MKQPAVYIVTNRPLGTLYIGVTSHLSQRIQQHKDAAVPGFSQRYRLKHLVWYELHGEMVSAITREKQLKKWNRAWKVRLIEDMNPDWIDLSPSLA